MISLHLYTFLWEGVVTQQNPVQTSKSIEISCNSIVDANSAATPIYQFAEIPWQCLLLRVCCVQMYSNSVIDANFSSHTQKL